ncbi:MAG: PD-(D/E)XK nuclease family protein, partial [Pyrinomonadaceae bacterium]
MTKEIWLGPVLGKNRERLLERCREYFANNQTDRLLYLAASHPLLDLVTDKLLDGKNAAGVWGEFPVYLFRGFVRRVLSSAVSEARPLGSATNASEPLLTRGLPTRTPIDREELPLRRSLISQIIKQLSASRQLQAIRPLANRDGCVNTISTLIGELQRAGKSPEEFRQVVEARENDIQIQISNSRDPNDRRPKTKDQRPHSQLDFDREVALIYAKYSEALDKKNLTDEDADQLRALQILRSDLGSESASLPWLRDIELLVLDGFFDFTPVQGEILRCLIPQIPNVIVNLNHDPHNEEIFRPFQSTVDHLKSIASFETTINDESIPVNQSLSPLRRRLFNVDQVDDLGSAGEKPQVNNLRYIQLLECADRELEIRSIAKEIKRLVLTGGYRLADIALVVRERAAYAEAIVRVFRDESIPLNLERRVEANDVPAVRACGKLFQLLKDAREHVKNPKATDLAHLIKTGYFRPSDQNLEELTKAFDRRYATLLEDSAARESADSNDKLRRRLGIGRWRPDDLENVIAYVGSELRIDGWVDRAQKLIKVFPSPEDAQKLVAGNDAEDTAAVAEDEVPPEDGAVMDRRKRPAPIHPAAIAWSILVLRHVQQLLSAVPEEGAVEDLRSALMLLLNQLQFSNQVNLPFGRTSGAHDVPQATVDVRGRESLRRAIAAAVRSFSYASEVVSEARPSGRAT